MKKCRTLAFKMNVLTVAVMLTVSLLLLIIANITYQRTTLEPISERLAAVDIPEELTVNLTELQKILNTEELERARTTLNSSEFTIWLSKQPSGVTGDEGERLSQLAQYMEMNILMENVLEEKSVDKAVIDVEKGGKVFSVYQRELASVLLSSSEDFGAESSYEGYSASDFAQPARIRNGDQIELARCIRLPLEGGEARIWLICNITRLIKEYQRFMWSSILTILILTTLAITVSMILIQRHVTRPVRRLAKAANEFVMEEDGTYSAVRISQADITSRDEIGDLGRDIRTMQERIVEDTQNLSRMTAERERINTELDLARKIQAYMLPDTFPAFPERKEFDLFASMKPAREVGGDFYDFFLCDDDHLALVIADVSGKGVPAAMFMTRAMSMIKNQMLSCGDPAQTMQRVNQLLSERNRSMTFVTVWLAVIELSTGKGKACNAGHENPCLRRAGGRFALLKYPHDLFVGVMGNAAYHNRAFELQPGDCLFVYTDGVPEAGEPMRKRAFGTERMVATLNEDPDAGPEELIRRMNSAVDCFADKMPQFDDVTMLCMKYNGNS